MEHMTNLEEFWANNNSVEDFKEVKRNNFISDARNVILVYFIPNPQGFGKQQPSNH